MGSVRRSSNEWKSSISLEDKRSRRNEASRTIRTDAEIKGMIGKAIAEKSLSNEEGELLNLFNRDPVGMASYLKEMAIAKNDMKIARLLGRLCGKSMNFKASANKWINENLAGEFKTLGCVGMAEGLATSNPQEALDYMGELDHGNTRDRVAYIAIDALATIDPEKAYDIYQQEYDSMKAGSTPVLGYAAYAVARGMCEKIPLDRLETIVMDPSFQNIGLTHPGDIACVLADQYLELAVQWCMTIPDEAKCREALERITGMQIRHNDVTGFANLISLASTKLTETEFLDFAVTSHEPIDGSFGTAWMTSLPASDLDAKLFQRAAMKLPTNKAEVWIQSLEQVQRRDGAVLGLIDNLVLSDVNAAAKWAATIQDAELRDQAMSTIQTVKHPSP